MWFIKLASIYAAAALLFETCALGILFVDQLRKRLNPVSYNDHLQQRYSKLKDDHHGLKEEFKELEKDSIRLEERSRITSIVLEKYLDKNVLMKSMEKKD